MRQLIPRQLSKLSFKRHRQPDHRAESVKPLRKMLRPNVMAEIYPQAQTAGAQKEGKKRMKQVGKVEIPQGAFLAALKV
jgi:GTP-binding protein LepA